MIGPLETEQRGGGYYTALASGRVPAQSHPSLAGIPSRAGRKKSLYKRRPRGRNNWILILSRTWNQRMSYRSENDPIPCMPPSTRTSGPSHDVHQWTGCVVARLPLTQFSQDSLRILTDSNLTLVTELHPQIRRDRAGPQVPVLRERRGRRRRQQRRRRNQPRCR